MLTLYYPPFRAEDDDELLRQTLIALQRYVIELSALDRDTLESRWASVLRAHKVERWPVIAAILDTDSDGNRTVGYLAGVNDREKRNQDIEDLLARVLWNGALGREAAEQGWADSLRIFISENARHPEPHEVETMRRGPAEADACLADLERQHAAGEEVGGIERLRGIREAMRLRNAKLTERILKAAA